MDTETVAGLAYVLKQLDDDWLAIFALLVSVECAKRPKFTSESPPNPPEGELEDCHPKGKRKDSALDAL